MSIDPEPASTPSGDEELPEGEQYAEPHDPGSGEEYAGAEVPDPWEPEPDPGEPSPLP